MVTPCVVASIFAKLLRLKFVSELKLYRSE